MTAADTIAQIEDLFARYGESVYDGARTEPVTARAHALQCAHLAEAGGAAAPLVAAALLHDIGHFLMPADGSCAADDGTDDRHEALGAAWLRLSFPAAVTEPIRLHVDAKRYLVAADPGHVATLSPASVHSLALQGGPMDVEQRRAFEARPFAEQALKLRRWDEAAKEPALFSILSGDASGIEQYRELLRSVLARRS